MGDYNQKSEEFPENESNKKDISEGGLKSTDKIQTTDHDKSIDIEKEDLEGDHKVENKELIDKETTEANQTN